MCICMYFKQQNISIYPYSLIILILNLPMQYSSATQNVYPHPQMDDDDKRRLQQCVNAIQPPKNQAFVIYHIHAGLVAHFESNNGRGNQPELPHPFIRNQSLATTRQMADIYTNIEREMQKKCKFCGLKGHGQHIRECPWLKSFDNQMTRIDQRIVWGATKFALYADNLDNGDMTDPDVAREFRRKFNAAQRRQTPYASAYFKKKNYH